MGTLQVKRHESTTKDSHGNDVTTYGDPVDWVVDMIAPGSMAEPGQAGRDLSLIVYTVYAAPSPTTPNEHDLVVYDSDDYEVVGRPARWPADEPVGIVVELARAEG